MVCDVEVLTRLGVRAIQPYQPGKPIDELARELGLESANIIKLASNENPLGPSPKVLVAIESAATELSRYPDGNGFVLKHALAEKYGIQQEQVTLGNGSNDVLELIARAFAGPGDEVIFSEYAFVVYPHATKAVEATPVVVPAVNWGHDLTAMANAVTDKTKLVFVANPNNPTGTWFSKEALEAFLGMIPNQVIVVLDEAYIEYVEDPNFPNGLDYLSQYPNLVVTRTFSKAYGLAGLRVGYSLSSPAIADILNRLRQAFNVNSLALVAAVAALSDHQYLVDSIAINQQGMAQLESGFSELGLNYIPSKGNFIAVEVGTQSQTIYQQLLAAGVIVRPVANYQMPNHLRVSIGLPEENQRLLTVLKQLVAA
ncbi:histidinol-phosphate transaminase [Spartinivicinus poritis]|uniref:Histidinol-phosphate aminotransferase n=1 Tax=Spartinivicinus poritis TaxID=2994640 RepID=A0ABT5U9R4_9GAMM|nr:histidinol-phosphate transaminase [Spartinivicinus sp. A2-2]MDE1462297.1 histidinol-phosphate transaminase [Spartinivicinus sp. A2-2]